MSEPLDLRDRLERLANRGDDRGPEWLIASLNRSLVEPAPSVDPARRPVARPAIPVVLAIVAVAAAVVLVLALGLRNHSASSPATVTTTTLAPVTTGDDQAAFFSHDDGWVCHVPLERSADGGVTWSRIGVESPGMETNLEICAFASGGHAWVTSIGQPPDFIPSVVSVVAGSHPTVTSVPMPGAAHDARFTSLAFSDALHGWALMTESSGLAGDTGNPAQPASTLYGTIDGGKHWREIATHLSVAGRLRFTSATTGWGLALAGVERTDDGGRVWRAVPIAAVPPLGTSQNRYRELWSVAAFGDRIVVAGIERELPNGPAPTAYQARVQEAVRDSREDLFIETSNDGGAHWSYQLVPSTVAEPRYASPWQFTAVDADHWRYVDATAIASTDDAGTPWRVLPNHVPFTGAPTVSFVTADVGYVAQCGAGNGACAAAVTTDGGKSWSLTRPSES